MIFLVDFFVKHKALYTELSLTFILSLLEASNNRGPEGFSQCYICWGCVVHSAAQKLVEWADSLWEEPYGLQHYWGMSLHHAHNLPLFLLVECIFFVFTVLCFVWALYQTSLCPPCLPILVTLLACYPPFQALFILIFVCVTFFLFSSHREESGIVWNIYRVCSTAWPVVAQTCLYKTALQLCVSASDEFRLIGRLKYHTYNITY